MEDLELGSLLKKAREEKGLSLADIQEETKIREKYLRAIEKNEFDLLPAKVYLKVFIKGYAREVGLDYQELLKKYEVLNIEEKKESNLEKDYLGGTKVPTRTKKKSKFGFLKIILISLLIIVLAAVGIYTYQYLNNSEIRLLNQKNNSANTLEENSQVLEVEDSKKEQTKTKSEIKDLDAKEKADSVFLKNEKEDKMDSLKNLNSDQIKNDSTIAENELDQLENLKTDAQTEISITEPNPKQKEKKIEKDENQLKENESSALENNTKTEININNESKSAKKIETKVNLAAAEKVWLQVSLDGNRVFSGILAKDTKKEYNFKDRLYLKIGNGSALKVKIGDKSYGPWAAKGEIAEIEFLKKEEEIVVNNLRK
ncbi:MAG: helix-turn-helix domain-containing protein [Bacillota bacterium]